VAAIPAGHGERFARIFHELLGRGIYLAPSGYEVGFLSLAHTEEQIDRTVEAILEAVRTTSG